MTKSDLHTGMRVTDREGDKHLVLKDFKHKYDDNSEVIVGLSGASWSRLSSFNEDLTAEEFADYDIVKVEIPSHCYDVTGVSDGYANPCWGYRVLWEREEVKEVTMSDVEDKFGCKVKIVG